MNGFIFTMHAVNLDPVSLGLEAPQHACNVFSFKLVCSTLDQIHEESLTAYLAAGGAALR